MENSETKYSVEEIFSMLTKQSFSDFYETDFVDHISVEDGCLSEAEILEKLKKLLRGW